MVVEEDATADARDEDGVLPIDLALAALVPQVITATVAVFVVFAVLRGAHGSKTWDKAMFVLSIGLAALLCIRFIARTPTRAAGIFTSSCAVVALLVGIGRIERQHEHLPGNLGALPHFFWEGFGITIAIVALCLALVFWRVLERVQAPRALRVLLTAVVGLVCMNDLISLIRTVSDFAEPVNNKFLLNEVLAPAAGKVPDATFVPQYTTLQGWLLVPFRHVMSPGTLASFAMLYMSFLGLVSVVLAVTIAYRTMTSPALWLAAGIVIPLTSVTVNHGALPYSSIASYMQQLPIRMFCAMLLSLLGLEALAQLRRGLGRSWHLPALGVLAGLIVWNSQDFGVVVTIAYCMLLVVALPPARRVKSLLLWAAGLLGGLLAYPLVALVGGTPIRLSNFGLFSRAFANGFASSPIQVPGAVLVVLPLLLASTSVGWCLLWQQRRRPASNAARDRATLTLALVGTWGTGGFVYYLNRSYASGQLQVLLMPCAVCLVALISLGREANVRLPRTNLDHGTARTSLALLPLALLGSLGLVSMAQSPSPTATMRDLTNAPADIRFSSQLMPLSTIQAAESYVKQLGGSLAYYGSNGSYIHLLTGLPDNLIFDVPDQAIVSPTLKTVACRYLKDHATDWLLTSPADVGTTDVCGLYVPVNPPGLPLGILYARIPEPTTGPVASAP